VVTLGFSGAIPRKIQLQVASVFQQQAQDARIQTEGCQLKVEIKMLFSSVIITALQGYTNFTKKILNCCTPVCQI